MTTTTSLRFLELDAQGMWQGIKKLERFGLSTQIARQNLNRVLIAIMENHLSANR